MFAEKIFHWYQENGRSLPWRETGNPYFIWLSEIILQQTRIEQGISYYDALVICMPRPSILHMNWTAVSQTHTRASLLSKGWGDIRRPLSPHLHIGCLTPSSTGMCTGLSPAFTASTRLSAPTMPTANLNKSSTN